MCAFNEKWRISASSPHARCRLRSRCNTCGAFSFPTPCAPALEGTPISPMLPNIVHLRFLTSSFASQWSERFLVALDPIPAVETPAQGSQVKHNKYDEQHDKQFHLSPLFCVHQSISFRKGAD
jgi:hypothetical protein